MELAPLTQRVTDSRRLDFDYLGAELGEQRAGVRSRDQRTQFENLDTAQWKLGARPIHHPVRAPCTATVIRPIPAKSVTMTSPGTTGPTPSGVPVNNTSPGSRV